MDIGKVQILGTLGSGANSTIYHVRRSADSRQYALKVVPIEGKDDQKFLEQARHEFKVSQLLDHVHLLKVLALETESDWLFRVRKANLLLEYVNGRTLDTFPGLRLSHLVQIFRDVADGLIHLHKRGVCHADLKPNNVMVSRSGDVKIIDYGLAWIKGQPKGRVQGTPEYMAPETASHKIVNERTDIYNLGAAMYRMVTGQLPPAVLSEMGPLPLKSGMFHKMLIPVRQHNPKAPQALADLIESCVAFDPPKRPERASVIQGTLDRLADEMVRKPEDRLDALAWQ